MTENIFCCVNLRQIFSTKYRLYFLVIQHRKYTWTPLFSKEYDLSAINMLSKREEDMICILQLIIPQFRVFPPGGSGVCVAGPTMAAYFCRRRSQRRNVIPPMTKRRRKRRHNLLQKPNTTASRNKLLPRERWFDEGKEATPASDFDSFILFQSEYNI